MHYLLFYEKAPDHAAREPQFQAAHRAHVLSAVARGELVLGGPLQDPTDGANVLLFRGPKTDVARAFATADPYVQNGIVVRWKVRPWQTVVGPTAECPLE
jgi:uncharacterized protein YciI